LVPSDALANDLARYAIEAVAIVHILAIVEAKGLFIEVTETMERLNANIGALDAAAASIPRNT
jgi:hypothetical protein